MLPEYAALSSGSMADTAQRVDRAFKAFFRRARAGAGAQSGYPRFRSVHHYPGFGFKRHGSGWKLTRKSGKSWRLYMKGVPGLITVRGKFPREPEKIKGCSLTLRAGVWWLSVVVEMPGSGKARPEANGEVYFDFIDSFARVRRVDGGCAAGPEDVVYAMADGRISPLNHGGCMRGKS